MSTPTPKPTILLIHGASVASWMWTPQIDALPEFRFIAPDLPEHGMRTETTFSLERAVDVLVQALDAQAPAQKVHIVGVSFGGTIALELLRRHAHRVESVLLSSASLGPIPGGTLLGMIGPLTLPLMKTPYAMRKGAQQLHIPDALYPQYEQEMKRLSGVKFTRINTVIHNYHIDHVPVSTDLPALVLVGENEYSFVLRNARALRDKLSGQAYAIPNGGHGWSFERPTLFNDTLRAWILNAPLPTELKPL